VTKIIFNRRYFLNMANLYGMGGLERGSRREIDDGRCITFDLRYIMYCVFFLGGFG